MHFLSRNGVLEKLGNDAFFLPIVWIPICVLKYIRWTFLIFRKSTFYPQRRENLIFSSKPSALLLFHISTYPTICTQPTSTLPHSPEGYLLFFSTPEGCLDKLLVRKKPFSSATLSATLSSNPRRSALTTTALSFSTPFGWLHFLSSAKNHSLLLLCNPHCTLSTNPLSFSASWRRSGLTTTALSFSSRSRRTFGHQWF